VADASSHPDASVDLAVPLSAADHSIGEPDAKNTLLEYGDYECPDCFNAQPVIAELREALGNDLRVVFRHFPLSGVHPHASAAAAAAEAAGVQGKFWDMHDVLFKNQQTLADLDLTHLALRIGLEIYRFQRDQESPALTRRVRADHDGGVRSGVKGTPTFFINGRRYRGKIETAAMVAAIQSS
jgi:protein-disulfide isomerase